MKDSTEQTVLIIGAGPAGLTAAYELLAQSHTQQHHNQWYNQQHSPGPAAQQQSQPRYRVVIFEETDFLGGISRTVNYKGNRMDMGGHRFFSKMPEVNAWWQQMLPLQGAPADDDLLLGRPAQLTAGGPDPQQTDQVMLIRERVSRILFDDKFYDYPVSLKLKTLRNMGLLTVLQVGFSYLCALAHKLPEQNLENFYINRFGRKLYSMFFEHYTENLWGRHPREIDASWGAQRVKGLSVLAVLKDIWGRLLHKKHRQVETSLIEQFQYPKLGPGQLWEVVAAKVEALGGTIIKSAKVVAFTRDPQTGAITSVTYQQQGQQQSRQQTMRGDHVISSMPLKDLVAGLPNVDANIASIAAHLPYRDYMTLGVLVRKLNLYNQTRRKTVNNIIPDCWVYVQDRRVKMGRFQVYNNWSPYMVKDLAQTIWLGLEYFVNEGDEYWSMEDDTFATFAITEMQKLGLIDSPAEVLDYHVERVKKAYPAYFDSYTQIDQLIAWLNEHIPNLYCVGRNGQHHYNNIDHSMCTAFEAVHNLVHGIANKRNIWQVNTEQQYHEERGRTS